MEPVASKRITVTVNRPDVIVRTRPGYKTDQ